MHRLVAWLVVASAAGSVADAGAADAAVRVFGGRTSDSDGVVVDERGVAFDAAVAAGWRLGVRHSRRQITDPDAGGSAAGLDVVARLDVGAVDIDGDAGVVRLDPSDAASRTRPQAGLRVRWPQGPGGLAGDLKLSRRPLLASPALLRQAVDLADHRLALGAVVDGPWRTRVRLRHAEFHEPAQTNRLDAAEVALVWQAAPATEVAVSHGGLGYRRAAASPYTAHRRVRFAELSVYAEWQVAGTFDVVVDAGIGRTRVQRFGESPRDWATVTRVVATVSAPVGAGVRAELGIVQDDSPLGGRDDHPALDWRSRAVTIALRFGIGR